MTEDLNDMRLRGASLTMMQAVRLKGADHWQGSHTIGEHRYTVTVAREAAPAEEGTSS